MAVLGGGPAGSFFSYFLLDMAERVGIDLHLDLYEARDFSLPGPAGCNMCGGVISESLVQTLATEGINLPPSVVERGLDSYVLHTDVGTVRIATPTQEMRIAAVHRGAGPKGIQEMKWRSFDGFLLDLAVKKGAHLVRGRVDAVALPEGHPHVGIRGGESQKYDFLAVAVGVNSASLKLFDGLGLKYQPPKSSKTYISEFYFGQETLQKTFGQAMHVFLLNLPRLEFAALIPKGDYLTFCMLGRDIDNDLVQSFLNSAEVRQCLPPGWQIPATYCHCSPKINVWGAVQPFADRLVFIGDCGVSRLYKDGIGAAYRTAKAAAVTAVFQGISQQDFQRHFWPVCRALSRDNNVGRVVFAATRLIQLLRCARRGLLRMILREQQAGGSRRMSKVLWDTFTGSAPYREVFLRTLHPFFGARFLADIVWGFWPHHPNTKP